MRRLARERLAVAAAVAAGFALRALFVWRHPPFNGDALVYGELAHHLIKEHVYGLIDGSVLKPTLIRLPGYPLFLAACFAAFGDGRYVAVLWVQAAVDLATCGLIAATVRRMAGARAGWWALWLAVLCPFTANYAAVAVAECCSLFCVALGFYALARWRERVSTGSWRWVVVIGIALMAAVLLRPDQGLLAVAVVGAMVWVRWTGRGGSPTSQNRDPFDYAQGRLGHPVRRMAPALVVCGIVALPLCVWAVRNWRVFHVVQLISPKYANDPDEEVPYGFMRWYRTWAIGFPATVKVYWQYDDDTISMNDLPARAFDSEAQREETARIVAKYNKEQASTPQVDAAFARLAAKRVRTHPFRYYVELPVARLADMWFRPRIAYMRIPLDWWRIGAHPWNSLRAYALGALNVAYLALACAGLWLWRRRGGVVVWAMAAFVVLRCALLLTIDNSEPRYTMECYPVVIVLAAIAMRRPRSSLSR